MERYNKTAEYKKVRKELLKKLEERGIKSATMTSKVDEYMDLWESRKWACDDIQERGMNVRYEDARGNVQLKKNDSVDMQLKNSLQMLKILQYLQIDPESMKSVTDDGDEL